RTSPAGEEAWEKSLTPELRRQLPADIQVILAVPENGRSPEQKRILTTAYRKSDMVRHVVGVLGGGILPFLPAGQAQAVQFRLTVEQQLADLRRQDPQVVSTLILRERKTPRTTHIPLAGDFTRKGAQVYPDVPAVLPPLAPLASRTDSKAAEAGTAFNRLDL